MKLKIGIQLLYVIAIKNLTKALATGMANHLNKIIDPSQTAYVPGRSVMDNIWSNF
jgi:hypothetical protein